MNPSEIWLIVFVCLFAGGMLGIVLRAALPEHHLNAESKDAIKFGAALISTMAALVLGLLVASAKGSYDTQRNEVTELAARIAVLDRLLAHYGPESGNARELLRQTVAITIDRLWPQERSEHVQFDPSSSKGEATYDAIQMLSPKTDAQRSLQSQAENLAVTIANTRWLMFEQSGGSISMPFLVVLVCWLFIIFLSYGLFAPNNATVVITMLLCALSVSAAIFLILELDRPFEGLIHISSHSMRDTLAHLGR
jgi:hypothetical protein